MSRGAKYLPVYEEVTRVANLDEGARKVFVHKLGPDATNDGLKAALEELFGPVASATVIMDKGTGKCKGYGFATFSSLEHAIGALEAGTAVMEVRHSCQCQ